MRFQIIQLERNNERGFFRQVCFSLSVCVCFIASHLFFFSTYCNKYCLFVYSTNQDNLPIFIPHLTDKMVEMGFTLEEIKDSLENNKFNNVTATYFLLGADSPTLNATSSSASSLAPQKQPSISTRTPTPTAADDTSKPSKLSSTVGTTAAADVTTNEESTLEAPGMKLLCANPPVFF